MSVTRTVITSGDGFNGKIFNWTLVNGETGDPVTGEDSMLSDRSVQVSGTFGAGGTVLIEGSNDSVTWYTLSSPANTALSFNAAGLKQIVEISHRTRVRVSAGDGTTNISVSMYCRRPQAR